MNSADLVARLRDYPRDRNGNFDTLSYTLDGAEAADRIEALEDILHRIKQWCEAYPIDIFPEPDFKRAHELLTAGGITLDAISASSMRHVVTQIAKMIPARRLAEKEDGRHG